MVHKILQGIINSPSEIQENYNLAATLIQEQKRNAPRKLQGKIRINYKIKKIMLKTYYA